MKIIEKNIGRHENGTLYFIARKNGKLNRQSLNTKCLEEARKKIGEMGTLALTSAREPDPPAVVLPVPLLAAVEEVKPTVPAVPLMSLAEALAAHDRGFLRFLASSGLRRSGALALRWDNVDFDSGDIVVRQKGGLDKVFPMTPEAVAAADRCGKLPLKI